MTKIKIHLYTIFLFVQISLTFGQTKFRLGKYEMNHSYFIFKDDSTFEHFNYIGCGGLSTFGRFKIIKDTLVLDYGEPIVFEENIRNDDSLKVKFIRAFANKTIPNMQIMFKLNSTKPNYFLSDSTGNFIITRNGIDSIYFDERIIEFYNDRITNKNLITFYDNFPFGKYKLKTANGVDLRILINPSLLNGTILVPKEKWKIIDEKNIFHPAAETVWMETNGSGQIFKWLEK
jgi:hypothetical protein